MAEQSYKLRLTADGRDLQDGVGKAAQAVTRLNRQAQGAATGGVTTLNRTSQTLSRRVGKAERAVTRLGRQAGRAATGGVKSLNRESQAAARGVAQTEQAVTKLKQQSTALAPVLTRLGALASVGGLTLMAKSAAATTLKLEGMQRALTTATGSAEAAKREWAFVRAESDRLGLSLAESGQAFVQLAGSTKGTATAGQQTRDIFVAVSEAATALQLTPARAGMALTALSQIASKGVVSMEELRAQLGEHIPGAVQIAARAMGMSLQDFNKLVESGQLLATDLLPQLAAQMSQEFAPAAADAAGGAQAAFNRLGNAINDVQVAFGGSGFVDGLAKGAESLAAALRDPQVVAGLTALGNAAGKTITFAAENGAVIAAGAAGLAAPAVMSRGARVGQSFLRGLGERKGTAGLAAAAAAAMVTWYLTRDEESPAGSPPEDLSGAEYLALRADISAQIDRLARITSPDPDNLRRDSIATLLQERDKLDAGRSRMGRDRLDPAYLAGLDKLREKTTEYYARQQRLKDPELAGWSNPVWRQQTRNMGTEIQLMAHRFAPTVMARDIAALPAARRRANPLADARPVDPPGRDWTRPGKPPGKPPAEVSRAERMIADLERRAAAVRRLADVALKGGDTGTARLENRIAEALGRLGDVSQATKDRVRDLVTGIHDLETAERGATEKAEAHRRARAEIAAGMDALRTPYERATAAARAWRDEQLQAVAGLPGAALLQQQIGQVFQHRMDAARGAEAERLADAQEQALRSSTDWRDGAIRGLKDWSREASDSAKRFETGMTAALDRTREAWMRWVESGKFSARDLFATLRAEAARAVYDKALGNLLPSLLSGLGGLFSGGGGRPIHTPHASIGGRVAHTGGILGRAAAPRRTVNAGVFATAPRYHAGGMLAAGEVPVIARRGEGIFTPEQMANAGTLIRALASRPPDRSRSAPAVKVEVIDQRGAGAPPVEVSQEQRGMMEGAGLETLIRVMIPALKREIAEGTLDGPMQQRYGARVMPV